MEQKHIDKIVDLFKSVQIWNDGRFSKLVDEYCDKENLDSEAIHKKLDIAFRDMLATSITSEAAIRFRLKNTITNAL